MPVVPFAKVQAAGAPVQPPDDAFALMAAAQMQSEGALPQPQQQEQRRVKPTKRS